MTGKTLILFILNAFLLLSSHLLPAQVVFEDGFEGAEPLGPPAAAPDLTGGTVHQLLADWTGSGFKLLTTAPGAPTYQSSPHAGSVWDEARQILWVFGAETHNLGGGYSNTFYRWDAGDGLFKRQYAPDPRAGYHVTADGMLYASFNNNRPWAMHTYRRLRYLPDTHEIEVMYDPWQHAFVTPFYDQPGFSISNRRAPFWYYNTVTGYWRWDDGGDTTAFVNVGYPAGASYWPEDGAWYVLYDVRIHRLDAATRVMTTPSWSGGMNYDIHNNLHPIGDLLIKFGGDNSSSRNYPLYSRHPRNDFAHSQLFMNTDFPVLNGWDTDNNGSVTLSDGRILFLARAPATDHTRAFILDPVQNTVTDTGHEIATNQSSDYDWKLQWSTQCDCAIWLTHRFTGNDRVYALRL